MPIIDTNKSGRNGPVINVIGIKHINVYKDLFRTAVTIITLT